MISKELLSEVIGVDVRYMSDEYDGNLVPYETREGWKTINIYELAHKCKEWALLNGFDIITVEIDEQYVILTPDDWQTTKKEKRGMSFVISSSFEAQNTEHEAIFKACQWILEDSKDIK